MIALHAWRPRPRYTPSATDLLWVLAATALTFALSSTFELQERLAASALRFEAWQLDEAPFTLTALALGLAWYAWRRRNETADLLARNRELAQQLIALQESERLALARELHDDLAQHCTAIRIEAACIQRSRDHQQAAAAAQRVADVAEGLHRSVRGLLRRLRPAELDELGLVAALHALCAAWRERSGVDCSFVHDGELDSLGNATDTALYRVTQEALANVMRHAGATRVRIELRVKSGALDLAVEDDGCGFDASTARRGLGLLGATERVAALGGQLRATSAPGGGTQLHASLPLRREVAA
jgi:two-component system sensor histidine kinase UhpB